MNNSLSSAPKFASVSEPPSVGEQLLDRTIAVCPLREEHVETLLGTSEATVSRLVVVDANGEADDRGEVPLFWTVVRDQLRAQASEEVPWVAGVLVKSGRAYRLRPLNAAQTRLVATALASLNGKPPANSTLVLNKP